MGYAANLAFGFLRAIFWSGGVYWRIPLCAALVPAMRDEVQDVLNLFGVELPENWVLYVTAGCAAAFVMACRLAYLETRRIKTVSIDRSYVERLSRIVPRYRVTLKNISLSDCNTVICRMKRIETGDEQTDEWNHLHVDLPFVLLTQEEFRHSNVNARPAERHPFRLIASDAKAVELFEYHHEPAQIVVFHQSGREEITLSARAVFRYEIVGPPVDPPPWEWSILKYVYLGQGGPECRENAISLKRLSRSFGK